MGRDTSAPILSASSLPAGLSGSLLFEFGDHLCATNFGRSEDHLVTRLQGVEHEAVLYLQILSSPATARANRHALCLMRFPCRDARSSRGPSVAEPPFSVAARPWCLPPPVSPPIGPQSPRCDRYR